MMTLKHVLETDVLVVGGGIGGLCAAISAAQGGARVTVPVSYTHLVPARRFHA